MIQELLGGGGRVLNERKISNPFSSTPPLLTTNTSIATTPPCTTTIVNSINNSGVANNGNGNGNSNSETNNNSQNLRCPRCDSTNTKFCYYNNYNLTQPRHFCKTCRRYWTKGGTLRNVPIGGGCRKNKSTISTHNSSSSSAMSKSSNSNSLLAKTKSTFSSDMLLNDNSLFLGSGLLDHSTHSPGQSSLPWSSLPQAQNSHILALLRGSSPFSNQNPNPSSNVFTSLGLDSYGNGAPSLLGSFTRNDSQHHLNGFAHDFIDNNNGGNSNILDLNQRLKSSSNYGYCSSNENPSSVILGHMVGPPSSTSSMNSTILEATPFGGDHMGSYGFMSTSPGISSWNEFPAVPINGAYP